MHERSLVRALLRQVEDLAERHSPGRVRAICVRLGELSGVEPELFVSAYDELVTETPLRGAALQMERVPLEATCDLCGRQFRIERHRFQCSDCGSSRLSIRGGEELLLESVTIEENER